MVSGVFIILYLYGYKGILKVSTFIIYVAFASFSFNR